MDVQTSKHWIVANVHLNKSNPPHPVYVTELNVMRVWKMVEKIGSLDISESLLISNRISHADLGFCGQLQRSSKNPNSHPKNCKCLK
jgi:hypothetical protein